MSTRRIISVIVILAIAGIVRVDFIFGPPQNLGPVVNSAKSEGAPSVSPDGLTLYFSADLPGGTGAGKYDLWFCTRPTVDDAWGPPVNLGRQSTAKPWRSTRLSPQTA